MEKRLILGLGQKKYKRSLKWLDQKLQKYSKNDGNIQKGEVCRLKRLPLGTILVSK